VFGLPSRYNSYLEVSILGASPVPKLPVIAAKRHSLCLPVWFLHPRLGSWRSVLNPRRRNLLGNVPRVVARFRVGSISSPSLVGNLWVAPLVWGTTV